MSGVEGLTKIASAGMQAGIVLNSMKTMINTLTNDDMDPFEKITTSLMSIGMIVPGVISSIRGVSSVIDALKASSAAYQVIQQASNALDMEGIVVKDKESATAAAELLFKKQLITEEEKGAIVEALAAKAKEKAIKAKEKDVALTSKEILKTAANATAKTGETAATEGATGAQWSLNAAMEANPIGAIIAAVMALIAALALLTFFILNNANAEDKEAKAVEEANKALDEAKEAAQKAKQAYEDLKSAISKYDTTVDALKKCTKGTQEWRDAFKEVLL